MAYNNNNSNRGFSNGGYNSNNNGGQQKKKRSGAKTGVMRNGGGLWTNGWKVTKRFGMIKFLCVETSKSKSGTSQSGRPWTTVMVKVQKEMCPEETTNGLMNPQTGQVTIQSMGIVINPKAPNGGYCGRYGQKRR